MKLAKIYTREDIRNLWRRYQHGDMSAGNDFTMIAYAQGKTFQTLKAEIEPECREEDEQPVLDNNRSPAEQRKRAGVLLWEKTEAFKQQRPELSNEAAFRLVLLENPTLAEQYTGFPIRRDG